MLSLKKQNIIFATEYKEIFLKDFINHEDLKISINFVVGIMEMSPRFYKFFENKFYSYWHTYW